MDENKREIIKNLRKLEEEDAIKWLLNEYSSEDTGGIGGALQIIPHLSWKQNSQRKLANYYMSAVSHVGMNAVVDCFSAFMSIELLCDIIWEHVQSDKRKMDFVQYYLPILYEKYRQKKEINFIDSLAQRINLALTEDQK